MSDLFDDNGNPISNVSNVPSYPTQAPREVYNSIKDKVNDNYLEVDADGEIKVKVTDMPPIQIDTEGLVVNVDVENVVEISNDEGNPIPVEGTVTVNNTEPILVDVNNLTFPTVQEVSGTVDIGTMPPITVDASGIVVNVSNQVEVTNAEGDPIPVQGTVSVDNFPAIQEVNGTVNVGNFPTTQSVTIANESVTVAIDGGTLNVTVDNPTTEVSVSNFPTSFEVSNQPTSIEVSNFPTEIAVNNHPTSIEVSNFPTPVTEVTVSNFPTEISVSNQPTSIEVNNFPTGFDINNFPTSIEVQNETGNPLTISGTVGLDTNAFKILDSGGVIEATVEGNGALKTSVSNFPTSFEVSNFPTNQTVTVDGVTDVNITNGQLSVEVLNNPTSINVDNFPDIQDVNVTNTGFDANITNSVLTVDGDISVITMPPVEIAQNQTIGISGTVEVSNQPTSIEVSNLPATQTVNGTVLIDSTTPVNVTVSNQPTSISVSNFPTSTTVSGSVEISNDEGNAIPITAPNALNVIAKGYNASDNNYKDIKVDSGGALKVSLDGSNSVSITNSSFEISNDSGNPIPISGSVEANITNGSIEINNDSGNPIPITAPSALNVVPKGFSQDGYRDLKVDSAGRLEVKLSEVGQNNVWIQNPVTTVEVANDEGNPLPVSGSVSISGTPSVSVSNFPATPTEIAVNNFPTSTEVSNFPTSFEVSNLPTTQDVNITNASVNVTVDNPTTNVTVDSLPSIAITNTGFDATIVNTNDINVNVTNQPTSIEVSNFPTNQTISGTVSVDSLPAIAITNTGFNVTNSPTVKIDATDNTVKIANNQSVNVGNLPSTQNVSFNGTAQPVTLASTTITNTGFNVTNQPTVNVNTDVNNPIHVEVANNVGNPIGVSVSNTPNVNVNNFPGLQEVLLKADAVGNNLATEVVGVSKLLRVVPTFTSNSGTANVTFNGSAQPVNLNNVSFSTQNGVLSLNVAQNGTVNTNILNDSSNPVIANIINTPNVRITDGTDTLAIDSSGNIGVNIQGTPSVNATISGTPSVSISGTPSVNATIQNASIPVTGTFWQATQPVSIASVPSHPVTIDTSANTVKIDPNNNVVSASFAKATTKVYSASVATTANTNLSLVAGVSGKKLRIYSVHVTGQPPASSGNVILRGVGASSQDFFRTRQGATNIFDRTFYFGSDGLLLNETGAGITVNTASTFGAGNLDLTIVYEEV